MRYDRETWRKQYRAEPAEQRVWPLMARGIRDLLIRVPEDDNGVIFERTAEPVEDLLNLLRPHGTEVGLSRDSLKLLLDEGYLQWEGKPGRPGKLWIKNFEHAQTARSKEAKRKADYRKRNRRTVPGQSQDGPTDVPGIVPGKRREEKRREDPVYHPRPRDPFGDHISGNAPAHRQDVQELHSAWRSHCDYPNAKLGAGTNDPTAQILADAIDAHGLPNCLLVAKEAPRDGMVNGRDDDKGKKHDSARYIFGNPDALNRILRAAQQRAAEADKPNPADVIAAAKARGRR